MIEEVMDERKVKNGEEERDKILLLCEVKIKRGMNEKGRWRIRKNWERIRS